jgi:hypothetical protein
MTARPIAELLVAGVAAHAVALQEIAQVLAIHLRVLRGLAE